MSLFRTWRHHLSHRPDSPRRVHLHLEVLEDRAVPSASGNAWPSPQLVTLSFVPDGTILGAGPNGTIYSNLFAKFNAHSGWTTATWQDAIISAAQAWAQQTNINFQVVSDNGTESGWGNYQQGDPGMGDIRIGGYAFSNTALAEAYQPPPIDNYSIAGDANFNTKDTFNTNGSAYDLFTVAAHEIGHALGLNHSTVGSAIMYASYNGRKTALAPDDISSIQSAYSGARTPDRYDAVASNNSFATATNLTATIDPVALTSLQTGLDITTTSDLDYYTFVAPATTTGTLTVNVQTAGLSLLRQAVTLYAADQQTVLGSASSANAYNGTTDTITISGVTPGQVFYLKVAGADSTAFGTGAYALTLNFGSGASPTVPLPNTQLLDGSPLQGGGGMNELPGQDPPNYDQFASGDPGRSGDHHDQDGQDARTIAALTKVTEGQSLQSLSDELARSADSGDRAGALSAVLTGRADPLLNRLGEQTDRTTRQDGSQGGAKAGEHTPDGIFAQTDLLNALTHDMFSQGG